jgi:exopolysaccharide biosynthesis polyprenyl glycosylphosphotransferase
MPFIKDKMRFPWLPMFMADFMAIVAAYYTTIFFRFHSTLGERLYATLPLLIAEQSMGTVGPTLENFYFTSALRIILILTVVICLLYAMRQLYAGRRFLLPQPEGWNILVANVIALSMFYAYWYLHRNVHHPRSMFASVIAFNFIFCILFRRFIRYLASLIQAQWDVETCKAILVGSGEGATLIASIIESLKPHGISCVKRIALRADTPFEEQLQTIADAGLECQADMLICADKTLSVPQIMRMLEVTEELQLTTKILSEKLDVLVTQARLPCDMIKGIPLVHFEASDQHGELGRVRRCITFVIAGLGLLVTAPLLVIIGLLVRITSHGPAIFVQERMGVNRKPFRMFKFRTMHNKAEELQAQIEEFNESEGALFKIRKDPRITPVGRVLRRFSLDELPQLLNIIKGEMALVGPRPLPQRDFANYYEEWHYSRHDGLPGLTCLWQISGRSNIDFHDMCILDVYYLRNHSWIMDLNIALRTIKVVLFGTGAY